MVSGVLTASSVIESPEMFGLFFIELLLMVRVCFNMSSKLFKSVELDE